MLHCKDLCIGYQNHTAVDQVTQVFESGRTYVIVGQSGCGKSSLLHALAQLIKPTGGHILKQDHDGTIAILLQDGGLFPWKTVYDNVALGLINDGLNTREKDDLITDVLKRLKIDQFSNRYLRTLSGGEKQRAAIARALVKKPAYLLLDEPSSGLDYVHKESFQSFLLELKTMYQMTLIIVTHDIEEAVFLGQDLLMMNQGRIFARLENPFSHEKHQRHDEVFMKACQTAREVFLYETT